LRDQALSQELQDAWWREGGFTEEQGAKVAEMRRRIEEEGLLTPWWDNRPCMQRFLAAKQWDVDKAVAMFRAHLAWRKEWHLDEESFVDTPHGRIPRLLAEFVLPEFPTIKDAYNYVHHGNDKSGRLIYVDRMGGVKLPQLRAACSEERLIMTYVWECEATACFRMPASTLAAGKLVDKTLSIVDLKGFSIPMFDARMRKYLSIVIKLSQDNYPEMLGKMYVINAPWVFTTVWKFISARLDERQRNKINILGGPDKYLPELLKEVDIESLPVALGGKDHSADFVNEQGPWAHQMPKQAGPATVYGPLSESGTLPPAIATLKNVDEK